MEPRQGNNVFSTHWNALPLIQEGQLKNVHNTG